MSRIILYKQKLKQNTAEDIKLSIASQVTDVKPLYRCHLIDNHRTLTIKVASKLVPSNSSEPCSRQVLRLIIMVYVLSNALVLSTNVPHREFISYTIRGFSSIKT